MGSWPLRLAAVAVCVAGFIAAQTSVPASAGILAEHELQEIERMPPQKQAERLLERAVSRYQGALEQIERRLPTWSGQLKYSRELQALVNIAYNSSDLRVREASIELTLTANGIAKDRGTAERFYDQVKADRQNRPWRLWILGLLANRGVETDDIRRLLLEFMHDPTDETRQWAVDSLSLLGTDDIIEPLLQVFATDPSPAVRERAGCSLAESGMLTREQRRKAIPGLLRMMDDPTIVGPTKEWVFQALREISGQDLGQDQNAWRIWGSRQR